MFHDYKAALYFLSEKFNIKTSQDWLTVFFLESWSDSPGSLYLQQFWIVSWILWILHCEYIEHYWSALTFSGKMYLFCCCSSRQSTQPKSGSTSSVSLPVSGGSNVSFQSLCYAVWVCQYMYYSGLSLELEWWFNAASVSKLLLCFFGPVPHTCSLELSSGLVFVSKVGDSLLQLSPLWDSPYTL